MRRKFLTRFVGFGSLALTCCPYAFGFTQTLHADLSDLESRIQLLLQAYEQNQYDKVIAMLDPDGWIVFGSDIAEVSRSKAELAKMMGSDFDLWRTAAFSNIRDLNMRCTGALASAMFHVDFSAGGRPPIPVRFCTTWRKVHGIWMLSQCANAVPTVHSSAAELLHR